MLKVGAKFRFVNASPVGADRWGLGGLIKESRNTYSYSARGWGQQRHVDALAEWRLKEYVVEKL
jgi:hypothetical protein